jgi:hypothetical protein
MKLKLIKKLKTKKDQQKDQNSPIFNHKQIPYFFNKKPKPVNPLTANHFETPRTHADATISRKRRTSRKKNRLTSQKQKVTPKRKKDERLDKQK